MLRRRARYLAAGLLLHLLRRPQHNRRRFSDNRTGLRILILHAMGAAERERFRRFVEWCGEHFDFATPQDADRLVAGTFRPSGRDRLLITFDDGDSRDFVTARWLADRNIRAIFFIMPALVGRTMAEFLEFHRSHGVRASNPVQRDDPRTVRGLSRQQLDELVAMGHRLAAHNHAHRDLGQLSGPEDLHYEVDRALDGVSELTGSRCDDFAWGFGNIKHLSLEATHYLRARCRNVYAGIRGLNVPGISPAFLLRDSIYPDAPLSFAKLCVRGGSDHVWTADRAELLARTGRLPELASDSAV